jgi:uncharacterized protein YjbI with pentapeptide repeats
MDTTPTVPTRDDEEPRESLLDEIRQLRLELQRREDEAKAVADRNDRVRRFTARLGFRAFAGSQLYSKTTDLWDAWSTWLRSGTPDPWPERSTRNFVAALLARFTRTGVIVLFFAASPLVITLVQLLTLLRQNALIDQQTELAESARRSALVVEQTAVLDEIDEELDAMFLRKGENVATRPRLSPRLEGRIIALSKSLRPYRYLDDRRLTLQAQSPERGQLFLALIKSQIDLRSIMLDADFNDLDLPNSRLDGIQLGSDSLIYLDWNDSLLHSTQFHSLMDRRRRTAFLQRANFRGSRLYGASFRYVDLRGADFSNAALIRVRFLGTELTGVNFTRTTLVDVEFNNGNYLLNANFEGAKLWGVEIQLVEPENVRALAMVLCRADKIEGGSMPPSLRRAMWHNEACARNRTANETDDGRK